MHGCATLLQKAAMQTPLRIVATTKAGIRTPMVQHSDADSTRETVKLAQDALARALENAHEHQSTSMYTQTHAFYNHVYTHPRVLHILPSAPDRNIAQKLHESCNQPISTAVGMLQPADQYSPELSPEVIPSDSRMVSTVTS